MAPVVARRASKHSSAFCCSRHVGCIVVFVIVAWISLFSSTLTEKKDVSPDECGHYNGILRIEHGDRLAAGTAVFFCYIINHLLYAEEHNLMPWIHLDDFSERIYDAKVHGAGPSRSFMVPSRLQVTYDCGEAQICKPERQQWKNKKENVVVHGNGVWESYFEPASTFSLDTNPCYLPYLTLTDDDLGRMHYLWRPSVRAWHYAEWARPEPEPGRLHEWYGNMRVRGAGIVSKYYRPKPWLVEAINNANPSSQCMSMHVRFTDKDGTREVIGVDYYRPYAIAYAQTVPEGSIYLATDSSLTFQEIKRDWPPDVVERIRMQPSVLQSSNATAVFDIGSHHRTNSEILTDVYAMAKCNVLLHGHSAVSESVVYVNLKLHNCSVDLEDPDRPTVETFRGMVGGDNPTCL